MSRTPEQLVYAWVMAKLPTSCHVQRIESSTAPGIPDINLIVDDTEVWLEVKAEQRTSGGQVRVRKEQWAWMKRRALAGGVCGVLDKSSRGIWSLWGIRKQTTARPSSEGHVVIEAEDDFTGAGSELLMEALQLLVQRIKNGKQ
jgi:hypothetical protein